ncbi:MAG: hypothetical protein OER98_12665 [Gammaproteobacteria bacterium]|nr:hypothetical protein [Gammaproteobacteria bacterium]
MSTTRFNLIFEGEIEPGYDQEEAHRTLESLFEFDDDIQAELNSGQAVMLGKSMDAATADSFKQALAGAGVSTYLLAENDAIAEAETPSRRLKVDRRSVSQRRAQVRNSAILPDRRKGLDRRL